MALRIMYPEIQGFKDWFNKLKDWHNDWLTYNLTDWYKHLLINQFIDFWFDLIWFDKAKRYCTRPNGTVRGQMVLYEVKRYCTRPNEWSPFSEIFGNPKGKSHFLLMEGVGRCSQKNFIIYTCMYVRMIHVWKDWFVNLVRGGFIDLAENFINSILRSVLNF